MCYTCGILNIKSTNLTVSATRNGTILSLTMVNNGSEIISNISVSIGFSPTIVVIPALAAGDQVWVSIQVSSSQSIKVGQSYQVVIAGGYGSSNTGAIVTVEASSS